MSKYVVLFYGGSMPEGEAEQKKSMDEWTAWYGQMGASVADTGNPFAPMSKNISPSGKITNESDCEAPNGYLMLKADSMDAAVSLSKTCPAIKDGASASVLEVMEIM